MKYARRIAVFALALALLVVYATAMAAGTQSEQSAFAVEQGDTAYVILTSNDQDVLFSVPVAGGELTQLDTSPALDELLVANGSVYYLKDADSYRQIMKLDSTGAPAVLSEFETGVTLSHLSFYDGVLYVIANDRIYLIDPENGDSTELCDVLVDDYVILKDVIFYTAANDPREYEKTVTGQTEPVKQSAGALYSMSILGTNPELLLDKGVTALRAYGDYLYFHNLEDNYVMGTTDQMWLEGKLYRYNVETAQTSSLNLDYDWDYYPTASGLLVQRAQDLSLYPLTGGEPTQLLAPDAGRTVVTASGDHAYVYEYAIRKLSRVPLDGSGQTVLVDDSDVLPATDAASKDTVLVDDPDATPSPESTGTVSNEAANAADQTYDEETNTVKVGNKDTYIFPNSSTKRLTREQVELINPALWGCARNEIYARHGYVYNNEQYKTYFEAKSWYKPGGFKQSALSTIEWDNMELIKRLESEKGLISGTSSSKGTGSSNAKNNYYILKEASSRRLTKAYIRKKLGGSRAKYALARNEILARHGYVFKTAKYRTYFKNQKWYKPGGYSDGNLSRTEWYNIEQLKEMENS